LARYGQGEKLRESCPVASNSTRTGRRQRESLLPAGSLAHEASLSGLGVSEGCPSSEFHDVSGAGLINKPRSILSGQLLKLLAFCRSQFAGRVLVEEFIQQALLGRRELPFQRRLSFDDYFKSDLLVRGVIK